ncbi:MAG: divalent-cation tolerance protein CutA [Magnetovibrio sp.]|nr:divalent-cation tolerance protein CutA [Magnetovibrio sp.]
MADQTRPSCQLVYVTMPNRDAALDMAKVLVEERLAACANVLDGMTSVYWWDGQVQNEQEAVLILKTQTKLVPALEKRIKALHSYDCPCVVSFDIAQGNPDFLDWIVGETTKT